MNYLEKVTEIRSHADRGYHGAAMKELGGVLEMALKALYADALAKLPPDKREKLTEAEKKIGGGRGIDHMGFGQILGLYRTTKLLGMLKKDLNLPFRLFRLEALDPIVAMRNDATHSGGEPSKEEIEYILSTVTCLLNESGLANIVSDTTATAEPPAEQAKGSSKLVPIVIAAVVLLAGGAYLSGAFGGGEKAAEATTAKAAPEAGKAPPAAAPAAKDPKAEALRNELDGLYASSGDPKPPATCASKSTSMLETLVEASKLLRDGKPASKRPQDADALARLESAAKTNPNDTELWALLAKAFLHMGRDATEVLATAKKALSACPNLSTAHNLVGNTHLINKEADQAKAAYIKALEGAPTYASPRFNLALLALQAQQPAEAINRLDGLLADSPHHPNAHFLRGRARLTTGDVTGATADLEEAVKRTPDNGLAHVSLGQAKGKAGDSAGAMASFCKAAELGHPAGKKACNQ